MHQSWGPGLDSRYNHLSWTQKLGSVGAAATAWGLSPYSRLGARWLGAQLSGSEQNTHSGPAHVLSPRTLSPPHAGPWSGPSGKTWAQHWAALGSSRQAVPSLGFLTGKVAQAEHSSRLSKCPSLQVGKGGGEPGRILRQGPAPGRGRLGVTPTLEAAHLLQPRPS